MFLDFLSFLAALVVIGVVILCLTVVFVNASTYPVITRSQKEKQFYDPAKGEFVPFPVISDPPSLALSVVVPAFDEEKRLPPMLDEALEFLEDRQKKNNNFSYEIVIVSDGSRDQTVRVANKYVERWGSNKIRVLDLQPNRGKGGAVRLGVFSSRGAVILFADADGATKFADLVKLEASLQTIVKGDYLKSQEKVSSTLGLVVGSRSHLEDESLATRSYIRSLLMHGFHFIVWAFAVRFEVPRCWQGVWREGILNLAVVNNIVRNVKNDVSVVNLALRSIKDTQCGFKLFTRTTAELLFSSVHVERWAFDVELLYLAEQFGVPMDEIPVNWTEIDGSKVVPVLSWIQMGRDVFLIWIKYLIGAWKTVKRSK